MDTVLVRPPWLNAADLVPPISRREPMPYGAFLAGVTVQWILVGAVSALGIGVLAGVSTMRQNDSGN